MGSQRDNRRTSKGMRTDRQTDRQLFSFIYMMIGINGGTGGDTGRHSINDGYTQRSQRYITLMYILIDCMIYL